MIQPFNANTFSSPPHCCSPPVFFSCLLGIAPPSTQSSSPETWGHLTLHSVSPSFPLSRTHLHTTLPFPALQLLPEGKPVLGRTKDTLILSSYNHLLLSSSRMAALLNTVIPIFYVWKTIAIFISKTTPRQMVPLSVTRHSLINNDVSEPSRRIWELGLKIWFRREWFLPPPSFRAFLLVGFHFAFFQEPPARPPGRLTTGLA